MVNGVRDALPHLIVAIGYWLLAIGKLPFTIDLETGEPQEELHPHKSKTEKTSYQT